MRGMGIGLPPKSPFTPPLALSTTPRLGSLLGSGNPLPVAPPNNTLAGLLSASPYPPPPPHPYASALSAFVQPPPSLGASSLLFGDQLASAPMWHYVRWRFRTFLANSRNYSITT